MKQQNTRAKVLSAADKAVNGTRDVAYGQPEDNFQRIVRLMNAHLQNRFGEAANELNAADIAMFLIMVKAGRLGGNQSHLDSYIDIAGYAACGAEVANAK